jgi:hypothetical protein
LGFYWEPAPRRLVSRSEQDAAHRSRIGPAISEQNAEAPVKAKLHEDRHVDTQPNETWAMDFVHDQLATGRKLRVLTIVDTFSVYPQVPFAACSSN